MALRSLALLVMLTVPGLVFAREPPPPHMPIGMRLDGSLSDELFLSLTKRWHNIALRVPPLKGYRAHEQYPTFDLSFRDALDRPVFRLNFVGRPDGNALSSRSQFMYRLSQSEVMPIFDELYLIGVLPPTAVRLNRVTVRVAEKYRPAVACRTIPMNSVGGSPLFWNKEANDEGGVAILRIDAAEKEPARATVRIYPPVAQMPPSKTIVSRPPPFEVTVQAGDTLATVYQGYKVLRVVPPAKVAIQPARGEKAATTGQLVGWIELDPNPLPPPAKQQASP